MSDELRIKDLIDSFHLDWEYDRELDSAKARFSTDASVRGGPAYEVSVESADAVNYQIVVNGDALPKMYATILEAKQAVEQQLAEDYPDYGVPLPEEW